MLSPTGLDWILLLVSLFMNVGSFSVYTLPTIPRLHTMEFPWWLSGNEPD